MMRGKALLNPKNQILIQGLLVIISAVIFCGWALSPSNFFQFDDYQWQWRTQTTSYGDLFNIIPYAPYNDRPVGAVFLKVLFGVFGVNNVLHHIVLLLVHIASSLLFFWVLRVVLRDYLHQAHQNARTESWKNNIPWVSAVFFAGWSTSTLRVVSWDAAIFDLLAAPLLLLSALCYLKAQWKGSMRFLLSVGCILFYGLALRTKEMVIALPCILACISLWDHVWQRRCLHRRAPFNLALLIAMLALMVIYVVRILWIKSTNHDLTDPSSPYFISTSPITLLRNLCRYTAIYFNPFVNEYIASSPHDSMLLYIGWGTFLGALLMISIKLFMRNASPLILIPVLFVLQVAPVLPMKNIQSRLYLYLPSMALSLLTATSLCWFVRCLKIQEDISRWFICTSASFLLLYYVSSIGVNPNYRDFYLLVGRENQKIYNSIGGMVCPPHGSTVALINVPEWLGQYCSFGTTSNKGDILRSYYHDSSLSTKVITVKSLISKDNTNSTHCYWDYNNGNLIEIKY